MSQWKTIPDEKVRHVWELQCGCSPDEGIRAADHDHSVEERMGLSDTQVAQYPYNYDEGNTPVCAECGVYMKYVRTEVAT